MPCAGDVYEPDPLAISLGVRPKCIWCARFCYFGGKCLGLLGWQEVTG